MKIALAQLNYHIGNFEGNFNKVKVAVQEAKNQGADLIVFAELAISGYPPRDFLEFTDFINHCEEVVQKIAALAQDIAVIIGSPSKNPVVEGKDLYNAAYFLADGQIQYKVNKALLPTYDIFDEYRYFEPERNFHIISYKGQKIALTVCEDIWNIGNENPLYVSCPMDDLIKENPDVMINISASPFDYKHAVERIAVLKANVERYKLPIFYVNHVGAQTEIIFDGGSLVITDSGQVYDEMPYFKEGVKTYDLSALKGARLQKDNEQPKDKTALIHDALVLGIKDYFRKLNFKKAIIGLSGGMDSALVAVLAVEALGAKNVRCLLMPSEFSSEHSVTDAKQLAKTLGVQHNVIPIQPVFKEFLDTLEPQFEGMPFNVAEENIQARIRGTLLMALANKFGYILLNTSNKSEMAVGYGTLYGDLAGGISVLGDVYKTEIYELAAYINRDEEIIPKNIIEKPPSAELRPDQKDTDSLPEYEVLDRVLFEYIENHKGPGEIKNLGFEPALVDKVLKLVNINEYKRHQTPPVLRVSTKAFGMGRRMPIVGKYLA